MTKSKCTAEVFDSKIKSIRRCRRPVQHHSPFCGIHSEGPPFCKRRPKPLCKPPCEWVNGKCQSPRRQQSPVRPVEFEEKQYSPPPLISSPVRRAQSPQPQSQQSQPRCYEADEKQCYEYSHCKWNPSKNICEPKRRLRSSTLR